MPSNDNNIFNIESIRKDFPILDKEFNGAPLIYFDNAASTQKPTAVISAIKSYYENDHSNYINKSRNILCAVGNYVYKNLKSNKVLINKPQGGFYLMPEFLNKKFNSSSEMCDSILNDTGVALLPGNDFGFDQTKMLTRLSFTDFDGQEFMSKIEDN